ncbi:hypothetical protein GCM10010399_51250 [Dactylosporangium fulvum]
MVGAQNGPVAHPDRNPPRDPHPAGHRRRQFEQATNRIKPHVSRVYEAPRRPAPSRASPRPVATGHLLQGGGVRPADTGLLTPVSPEARLHTRPATGPALPGARRGLAGPPTDPGRLGLA